MRESAFTAVDGTGRKDARPEPVATAATRSAMIESVTGRTCSGSPSQGRDQVRFLAVSLDRDAHLLSRFPGAQCERVVIDIVDADAVEADDDVVRGQSGLLRRAVVADAREQHAALGLHVVRDRAEPRAVATAAGDAAGRGVALRLRVRGPRAGIERLAERLG